ncbi:hypothetical protein ACLB2K_035633 [Fragaria x ananassa]
MAGGGIAVQGGGRSHEGGVTVFVVFACVAAATGGLLFGYDIGISGGVTSMESFLSKFFPSVYHKMKNEAADQNQYCKFDSQLLTLFTSSLYIAALVASFLASSITRRFGRKSVPVYLAEIAPTKMRGALNMGLQMAITIGILVAGLVNFGTAKIKGGYGWRISLAVAAIPSMIMTVCAMFLPDTPNSMLERGHPEKARKMLQKIRGSDSVNDEFQDLVDATEAANKVENQWGNIMQQRYRPQLIICVFVPFFQQLTGIKVITGSVNVLSTVVSMIVVDKFGRKALFLEGGLQMIICQIAVGVMIALQFGLSGQGTFTKAGSWSSSVDMLQHLHGLGVL